MRGDGKIDIARLKQRVDNTWGERTPWTRIYQDA